MAATNPIDVEGFEGEWRRGAVPPIGQIIADAPSHLEPPFQESIFELVAVDMEFRWRNSDSLNLDDVVGPRPSVRHYAGQIPRLGAVADLPPWLIAEEYRARRLWGDRPDGDRFLAEYPCHLQELASLVPKVDRELVADGAVPDGKRIFSPPAVDRCTPLQYSDYVLEQFLGAGGMGKVYMATDRRRRRRIAIKSLLKSRQYDNEAVKQFIQEAQLSQCLDHQNIVKVHGLGRFPGGGYFLAMDFIEGSDLHRRISTTMFSVAEAVRIAADVADAVHFAHDYGIVHCDVKPANVMMDERFHVFVGDFGLARLVGNEAAPLNMGGTLAYMAPERLNSPAAPPHPTIDVFGIGGILYALCTGRAPMANRTIDEVFAPGYADPPLSPPSVLRPGVPPVVDQICATCLRDSPDARFQSAADVRDALKRWLAQNRESQ